MSSSSQNNIITSIDQSCSLSDQISQYVLFHKPKLYILTPCYGGMCHLNYTCALIKTIEVFKTYNFPLQIEFCRNDSLVSRARNNLVAKAMTDPGMTHIIFIDSDITWDAMDIFKLVLSNKLLIGGVYPLKNYFWDKILPYENKKLEKLFEKKKNQFLISFIQKKISLNRIY
jgi:hypothetical protein